MKISNLLAVAGLVAAATSAHAVAIPGLSNTGAGLTAGQADLKYTYTSTGTPALAGGPGFVTDNSLFPMNVWLPNNATSSWLTPTAVQGASYDPTVNGTYTWTYTFNLTGFIPSTATLTGRFLADNQGTVSLNGNLLATTPANAFTTWTTFSPASSSFVAGINTLTFAITNAAQNVGANPTGIRVEFTASNVTAVPEPSALVLSLAGLAMVGGLAKRRLSKAA
jgi:hypothetical protein